MVFNLHKELWEFRDVVKSSLNFDVGHFVVCMGRSLQPQEFVKKHLQAMPFHRYRAVRTLEDADEVSLIGGVIELTLNDPMSYQRCVLNPEPPPFAPHSCVLTPLAKRT